MAIVKLESIIEQKVPPHFKETCTSRVLSAKAGVANESKNPRIQLECEIVRPDKPITAVDGKEYLVEGLKYNVYIPTKNISDEIKDAKVKSEFKSLVKALEIDEAYSDFDDENPDPRPFEGIVFEHVITASEDKPQRKNAQGQYEDMKDGEGKVITRGWTINMQSARDILRRSTVDVNRPF